MNIIRYWIDGDKITSHFGNMTEWGDFKYQGTFGINTRQKDYHHNSKKEAVFDEIFNEIMPEIEKLNKRKEQLMELLKNE